MRKLIYQNRYFLVPYFLFLIGSIFLMLLYNKPELHIMFNQLNTPFLDGLFKRMTYLGDGIIYLFLLAILLFYNYRWSIIFTSAVVFSSVLVTIGKRSLFPDSYRPAKYFELYQNYQLHIIKGVDLHSLHSFPSGHTCTAFTIFFMLAFLVKSNALKFVCFLIALLTGYSRIYLSQHFLIDVFTGSVIGTGSILLAWQYFERFSQPWLERSFSIKRRTRLPKTVTNAIPES